MKLLHLTPINLDEANAFVEKFHRHRDPVVGAKYCIAVAMYQHADPMQATIVGVVIVGRPVARHLDDGRTLEVTRLCTVGTPNACSMLYRAAYRAAKAMGYRRMVTYTLASEPGTSLRAAGWKVVGEVKGRSWDTPTRPRVDTSPRQDKLRWEAA